MNSQIEIRKANRNQAAEIARLIMMAMTNDCCLHFCGEGHGLDDFREMMTHLVERDDSQYSWRNTLVAVAIEGNKSTEETKTKGSEGSQIDERAKVVGIATAYDGAQLHGLRRAFIESAKQFLHADHSNIDDETQAGELYLDSLAVLPEYRRQGIASRLLRATAERAAEMGIPQVGLLVDKGNPAGERLYRSVGFIYAGDSQWGGHPMKHLVQRTNYK
ncbi:MAG: GNAT family N-acetyltransferase [Prevotella sp.]|nr:GNAT family N-acetyltransferase [Prevotella sp.]